MPPTASGPDAGGCVTWMTFAGASSNPMGLQHYEIQVLDALRGYDQSRWTIEIRGVGSLRAETSAQLRLPMGLLRRAPTVVARAVGAYASRGAANVHRFDLRLPPASGPEVVTVHDLPPLRFDDEGRLPPWSVSTADRARLVICPSAFAASEVSQLLGVNEVVVIPNGVSEHFRTTRPFDPWPANLPRRYVLHVGGATERKNLRGLGEAWRRMQHRLPEVSLLLAGPPDPRRDAALAGCERAIQLGYRSPEQIAQLMAGAVAVVVPSLYEGFGLPAAEAMATGTPVVASRAGALPEVCGDAALLVEPSPDALAAGLVSIVRDHDLRTFLRRRGPEQAATFTWQRSARSHLAAYDRAFR